MLALLALSLASLAPSEPLARKGYYALADRVDDATFICIGRVEEIVVVPTPATAEPDFPNRRNELPIARVAVERVLKGTPEVSVIHHEAWGTWACDTTGAEVGQRAIFLLAPLGQVAQASEPVRASVHAAIGTDVLLRNVGSGDGILTIPDSTEGSVSCMYGPTALRSEEPYASDFAKVVAYIEDLVRFRPEAVIVHQRRGTASYNAIAERFDFRLLSDGQARLATQPGSNELVENFVLRPQAVRALMQDLELDIGNEIRTFGNPTQRGFERKLIVRSGAGELTWAEQGEGFCSVPGTPEEERLLNDAQIAWAIVSEALAAALRERDPSRDLDWLVAR
jgi:hypothetical protein